ncbi:MAG TPA: protein phosphatase CheZ [Stellaceae bacterium]|nr:protein phosphatase CheZ [Stellaceae bacterium]
MRERGEDADIMGEIKALSAAPRPVPEADAVASVVEAVLASLSGEMSVADLKLYHELQQLARYIAAAKREIAEIEPSDINARIPEAADELDAVVEHTAEATGTILDAAETMEKLAPTLAKDASTTVANAVTRIYEACNFQDITGQRITKVVKTLKYIEQKIDALLAAFGDGNAVRRAAPSPASDESSHLMSGPQLPAIANTQADIDAILAQLDKRA